MKALVTSSLVSGKNPAPINVHQLLILPSQIFVLLIKTILGEPKRDIQAINLKVWHNKFTDIPGPVGDHSNIAGGSPGLVFSSQLGQRVSNGLPLGVRFTVLPGHFAVDGLEHSGSVLVIDTLFRTDRDVVLVFNDVAQLKGKSRFVCS